MVGGQILVPKDASIFLRALQILSPHRRGNLTEIRLVLDHLHCGGRSYPLDSASYDLTSPSGKRIRISPSTRIQFQLLGLDAVVVTTGRRIAAADFFTGLYETALEAGELVTAVEFNAPRCAAYAKFRHPASGFAIVGAFVAETDKGPRVAITEAGATAFRVPAYEQALARSFRPESLAGVSAEFDSLNSDRHAPAEYRASLIPEMVRRALVLALQS
ncbi:MAG TPA: hypothetical protein VNJ52_01240 [Patescibacteria group bacterium]|nr:hypothetical protein [Patescibacteria group bacterium]